MAAKNDFRRYRLAWVPASPHIPFAHSAYFYPVSGILGELGYMSIGGLHAPLKYSRPNGSMRNNLPKHLMSNNCRGLFFALFI